MKLLYQTGERAVIVYDCLIGGVSALGAALCWKRRSRVKDGVFLFAVFAVLIALSSIRYHVGVDYSYIYSPFYEGVLGDPTGEALRSSRFEPAFKLLAWAVSTVSANYQTLFVVTSVLILALVAVYFWLHSPNPFISVYLFLVMSMYYCSMNFLRQTLAAAIALYALPLARKRTPLSVAGYFAIVLLAASFHKSALILIPAYFLFRLPFNRIVLAAYAAVTALVYFNTHRILALVTRFWYAGYSAENRHMTATFEFQFTLALAVAFLVMLLGSRILRERTLTGTVYLHCAYFAVFFALMGTRHSIVDRLSLYFELCIPVGIAIIANHLGTRLGADDEGVPPRVKKAAFVALLVVVYGGGFAIHQFALTKDYHGVVPYQIVFRQPFYAGYAAGLGEEAAPEADDAILMEPVDPILTEPVDPALIAPDAEPGRPRVPQAEPFRPEAEAPAREAPKEVPLSEIIG